MDITEGLRVLARSGNGALYNTLSMEFFPTDDPCTVEGKMPVDERHTQPFGYLCGGATLAFAEIISGVGSFSLCPGKGSVGMNVSGNHIHSVPQGEYVTAVARIIHKGRQSHVWNVCVYDQRGKLASSISVTNYIIDLK